MNYELLLLNNNGYNIHNLILTTDSLADTEPKQSSHIGFEFSDSIMYGTKATVPICKYYLPQHFSG